MVIHIYVKKNSGQHVTFIMNNINTESGHQCRKYISKTHKLLLHPSISTLTLHTMWTQLHMKVYSRQLVGLLNLFNAASMFVIKLGSRNCHEHQNQYSM